MTHCKFTPVSTLRSVVRRVLANFQSEEMGSEEYQTFENETKTESKPEAPPPPKDNYNLFVGIFLWIGIGCLMPWNFFINGTSKGLSINDAIHSYFAWDFIILLFRKARLKKVGSG